MQGYSKRLHMLHSLFDQKMAKWLNENDFRFPPQLIVSFSGGKDSTAMLLRMIERGYPIFCVLFYDGGWDFPEMHEHIRKVAEYTGLKVILLRSEKKFDDLLIKYRWPDSRRRWCTRHKIHSFKHFPHVAV